MSYYDHIPDYNELHDIYEARQERELAKYPKCDCCDEPITEDILFDIEGDIFCEACMMDNFKKFTSDYMD